MTVSGQSEFEFLVKPRQLTGGALTVEASHDERAALAQRFGLASIDQLRANVSLEPDSNAVSVNGRFSAAIIQYCSVSAEEFPTQIDEELAFRFVADSEAATLDHATQGADIEIELSDEDCDTIHYAGDAFDLGEAIAQSLGLAIDPYAEGPTAETARKTAGITREGEQDGPLAELLSGLKRD